MRSAPVHRLTDVLFVQTSGSRGVCSTSVPDRYLSSDARRSEFVSEDCMPVHTCPGRDVGCRVRELRVNERSGRRPACEYDGRILWAEKDEPVQSLQASVVQNHTDTVAAGADEEGLYKRGKRSWAEGTGASNAPLRRCLGRRCVARPAGGETATKDSPFDRPWDVRRIPNPSLLQA